MSIQVLSIVLPASFLVLLNPFLVFVSSTCIYVLIALRLCKYVLIRCISLRFFMTCAKHCSTIIIFGHKVL